MMLIEFANQDALFWSSSSPAHSAQYHLLLLKGRQRECQQTERHTVQMFISSCGSTSPQHSSQWAMKGWFSSISSAGRSQKQMILPPLLMNMISSRQQGQVEWCRHHRTRHPMQNEWPHSRLPNSSSVVDRQIAHFSAALSATSLMSLMRLATRGLIRSSVFLEDASMKRVSLLFSVAQRLDWLRVDLSGTSFVGYECLLLMFAVQMQNCLQCLLNLVAKYNIYIAHTIQLNPLASQLKHCLHHMLSLMGR